MKRKFFLLITTTLLLFSCNKKEIEADLLIRNGSIYTGAIPNPISGLIAIKGDKIVYIGDGGGDYCPCCRLRQGRDVALVRQNYPLHKKMQANSVAAKWKEWNTGYDILRLLQELLPKCG